MAKLHTKPPNIHANETNKSKYEREGEREKRLGFCFWETVVQPQHWILHSSTTLCMLVHSSIHLFVVYWSSETARIGGIHSNTLKCTCAHFSAQNEIRFGKMFQLINKNKETNTSMNVQTKYEIFANNKKWVVRGAVVFLPCNITTAFSIDF